MRAYPCVFLGLAICLIGCGAPAGAGAAKSGDGKVAITQQPDKEKPKEVIPALSEAEVGIPFYPGSTESPNMSIKSDSAESSMRTSVRTTSDEPAKVSDFYKSKLKNADVSTSNVDGNETYQVSGMTDSGGVASISINRQQGNNETLITSVVTTDVKK